MLFLVIQWIVLNKNSYNKKHDSNHLKKKQKGLEEENLCTLVPESIHFLKCLFQLKDSKPLVEK